MLLYQTVHSKHGRLHACYATDAWQNANASFVGEVLTAMGVAFVGLLLPGGPAAAQGTFNYLTGPLYEPIRDDVPYWLRSLVWNDFRYPSCTYNHLIHKLILPER